MTLFEMLEIHGPEGHEPMPRRVRTTTMCLPDGREIVTVVNGEFADLGLGVIKTQIAFAPGARSTT